MIDTLKLRGPLGWSLLSVAFMTIYGIYACSAVLSPLLRLGGSDERTTRTEELLQQHDEYVTIDIARFNGRSAFFQPIRKTPAPPPKPPNNNTEKEVPPGPPQPPPPPSTFMGPPLIAIIGDEAWFRGSGTGFDAVIRLKPGEERDGLKLISTSEPSIVTVQHRGGEYEIDLFSSDEHFFLMDPPPDHPTSFLEEVETAQDSPNP